MQLLSTLKSFIRFHKQLLKYDRMSGIHDRLMDWHPYFQQKGRYQTSNEVGEITFSSSAQ